LDLHLICKFKVQNSIVLLVVIVILTDYGFVFFTSLIRNGL